CFFLPPFSCSTAPQAFSRPDRISSQAGARRCCQGWPLLQRPPPSRGPAFTAIEHGRQGLIGRVDYTPVCYLSVLSVSAHYSDDGCCFWQALLRSPRRVR